MKKILVLGWVMLQLSGCASFSSDEGPVIAPVPDSTHDWPFKQRWSRSVGDGELKDVNDLSPLVLDNNVYTADPSGQVMALNAQSGDLLWEKEFDVPFSTGFIADNNRLFAGSRNGYLLALNVTDGSEVWRKALSSEVLSLPAVASNLVVTHNADGRVMAFGQDTGQPYWRYDRDLPELSLRGESRPVLVNGGAVVGFANGKLGVLLLKDGQLAWEQRISDPQGRSQVQRLADVDATPIVAGDEAFAIGYQGNLSALRLSSGEIRWQTPTSSYRDLALDAHRVYAVTAEGTVKALDRDTGKELWQQSLLRNRSLTAPVLTPAGLVVGDAEGYLHLLDPETGAYWSHEDFGGDGINQTPVLTADSLLILTRNGRLHALALPAAAP